jgi:tetratricopeptide (TPR) repeat protein
MKFEYFLFWFSIIFSFHSLTFGKDEDRLFYDAVRAEASGDLDQAITYYLQASKLSHSSNLHGNLANLYFKKEQFGHSILHFRKALLLKPNNNQLSTNLDFAHDMAKIPPITKNFASSYFSRNNLSFWCILSVVLFWLGLLLLIYLFLFKASKVPLLYFALGWFLLCGFVGHATRLSYINNSELSREVIAFLPSEENNQSKAITLRRFAGEKNSANTTLLPGESLIIDLGKDGMNKTHQSPDGKNWYLARSKDGKKKGWIQEDEFGWLLDSRSSS